MIPSWTSQFLTLLLVIGTSATALAAPYVPPSGIGAPGRRESAGTRGCLFGNPSNLVALAPEENMGWTTQAYPRFYWYLPTNQASFVEFTLAKAIADSDTVEDIYSTRFDITGDAGIMSLELPATASIPPLQTGDRYRWQVTIFCNPEAEEGELSIYGWIERRLPEDNLADQLELASEIEKADLYATNGYWFDAVDQLVSLSGSMQENIEIQTRWVELLDSVQLGNLVEQPVLMDE
ncbi:DUF928 domain-containing protein [Oscillatoria sp. CS-180]|nr:DUF928 domain-containing protein [Oscillatoria sp. CS-180]